MAKNIVVMIDGGHLKTVLKKANKPVTADYISKIALSCSSNNEEILRVLYYDCAPFNGEVEQPISRIKIDLSRQDTLLNKLGHKDLFAIRRGVLKFRGWTLKRNHTPANPPIDADFEPKFMQKGVDMRIGLDMATFSENKSVSLIALITNDTDCIPAMKHARRSGIQVALVTFPNGKVAADLVAHTDFKRTVGFPK